MGKESSKVKTSSQECDGQELLGESGLGRADTVRAFVAGILSMMMFMLFNGTLYLTYDGIFDWSRDLSTIASIVYALSIMVVARRRPRLIKERPLSMAVCIMALAGYALSALGVARKSAACVIVGVVLVGPADLWGIIMWMLSLARLSRRDACLLMAGSGLVGIPLAFLVNTAGSYWLANVVTAAAALAIICLCRPLTRDFFRRLSQVAPPSEQHIARPNAYLPLSHAFYVYIFVFSVAYGFALRCENGAGPEVSTLATAAACAAVGVYAWRARESTRVDSLHVAALLIVAVGFMFVLMGDDRVVQVASFLLMMGYMCYQLLIWLALSSAAQRNTAEAIPTICWGNVVSYVGITAGVTLWLVPNHFLAAQLAGDTLLQDVLVVAILAGLVLFSLLTRRTFVFDSAIAQIEPDAPAPQVEVRYIDELDERCAQATERYGLTAREAAVMGLLARGNTASHIQAELGISYNTVKYHVKNIYSKVGVHSQQSLIDTLRK